MDVMEYVNNCDLWWTCKWFFIPNEYIKYHTKTMNILHLQCNSGFPYIFRAFKCELHSRFITYFLFRSRLHPKIKFPAPGIRSFVYSNIILVSFELLSVIFNTASRSRAPFQSSFFKKACKIYERLSTHFEMVIYFGAIH